MHEITINYNNLNLYIQINSDNDFDYTLSDLKGCLIDGGIYENTQQLSEISNEVIDNIIKFVESEG